MISRMKSRGLDGLSSVKVRRVYNGSPRVISSREDGGIPGSFALEQPAYCDFTGAFPLFRKSSRICMRCGTNVSRSAVEIR